MPSSRFIDIGDAARRQYIDAEATFTALDAAVGRTLESRGGMFWKTAANGTQYLIRTNLANGQKSLGVRDAHTEAMHASFTSRKREAEGRVRKLRVALRTQQRMNRALGVGRTPAIVVDLLNALDAAGVSEPFTVVGTHALYAYESAAGVRIDSAALATQDVDFLFDTRKRLRLATQLRKIDKSIIAILRKVDDSFRIKEGERYSAVNDSGFAVDILRREVEEDDPHPLKLSDAEDEFWVVQARNAKKLLQAPRFSAVVMSASGHMARMNTIHPKVFTSFKRWLAKQESREPVKRSRDVLQAKLVTQLVQEYLPQYANIHQKVAEGVEGTLSYGQNKLT